jgi:hypothetical protein
LWSSDKKKKKTKKKKKKKKKKRSVRTSCSPSIVQNSMVIGTVDVAHCQCGQLPTTDPSYK